MSRIRQQEVRKHRLALVLGALVAMSVTGCGGRAYVYDESPMEAVRAAVRTQADGAVTVSAAVPGREQSEALFGIDLYSKGIQPVWLEVTNGGENNLRYAPVSTDHAYFSPLEVAWKFRGPYSKDAEFELQKRLYVATMPRWIRSGETRSGFVFTHLDDGAKGFNVDVYAEGEPHLFTFLLRVPGFTPDYADVDFEAVYDESEIRDLDADLAYQALADMPCCTETANGGESLPINLVLIGQGGDLLRSLLRSGWLETAAEDADSRRDEFLFGRRQDGVFRYETLDKGSSYELRLWLAPVTANGEPVWLGQVKHYFRIGGAIRREDADIDNARNFSAQKFIYGQAARGIAWFKGAEVVPVESFWDRLTGSAYFTDGYRLVLWLSGDPVSSNEIRFFRWDAPPEWAY